jgi:hypothetical protein
VPEVSDAEAQAEAQKLLNQIQQEHIKASDPVEALARIRQKLGISKPSPTAIGQSSVDALKANPSSADAVRTRALSKYNYAPQEGELSTTHRVLITDPKGNPAGEVTAIASKDSPNDWTMNTVESTQKQGTGASAYRELFRAAQKQADASGKPVVVRSGGVKTPEASNLWASTLKKQGYDVQNGEVTFKPKPKAPVKASAPNWMSTAINRNQAQAQAPKTFMGTVNTMVDHAIQPSQDIDIDLSDEWK